MSAGMTEALFIGTCAAILLVMWWRAVQDKAAREDERARAEAEWQQKDEEFWKAAKHVRAKVVSVDQLGMVNLKPNLQIKLRVEGPEGPYDIEAEQHFEYTELHRLSEGSTIDVWVDPKNRSRFYLCSRDAADDLDDDDGARG